MTVRFVGVDDVPGPLGTDGVADLRRRGRGRHEHRDEGDQQTPDHRHQVYLALLDGFLCQLPRVRGRCHRERGFP